MLIDLSMSVHVSAIAGVLHMNGCGCRPNSAPALGFSTTVIVKIDADNAGVRVRDLVQIAEGLWRLPEPDLQQCGEDRDDYARS